MTVLSLCCGLQPAGAALQGPRVVVRQAADTRGQVTGPKRVTLAALQMPRRCMASMMKPQRRCPVLTEMRGRRTSSAQVRSVLAVSCSSSRRGWCLDLSCPPSPCPGSFGPGTHVCCLVSLLEAACKAKQLCLVVSTFRLSVILLVCL